MRNMYVEYLRVVFISFIVLLHILWNDYGGINVSSTSHALCTYTQLGLTNMVGLGVTGFILISGYYGVNLKMNRLVSLWLQTTVYSLLSVVILCVINNDGGLFRGFLDSLLSLFDGWWFVSYYLVLMLLSPLINKGIEVIDKKKLSVVIILLTFILYGAQWFHCRNASMSLLLFFNTYLVGRYIRLYPIPFIGKYKLYIFFISLLLLVCEPILLHAFRMDAYLKYITGNLNVLILLVDVTLLLLCNSKIKEGKGNFLTKNILAVYLIHESGVGRKILHDYIPYPAYFDVLYVLGIVVAVVFICTLIEEIRKKLMNKVEYSLVVGLRKYLSLDF